MLRGLVYVSLVTIVGCTASPDAGADATASDCVLDGGTVAHGTSQTFYETEQVAMGRSCAEVASTRQCNSGTLEGDDRFRFARCEVSGALHIYASPAGDDTSSGLTEALAVRTISIAVARVRERVGTYEIATIHVAPGTFPHDGQLTIDVPMSIVGAGRNMTTLAFSVTRDEASLRVLSGSVAIADLEIEVDLVESLSDNIHVGGRAEYGTGITIGEYLTTTAPSLIDGVTVHNIRIARTHFTAAAMTIIGRVQNIEIQDIDLTGYSSTALIIHWGGHSTVAPSPAALDDPNYDLYETYHPHDIVVRGVSVERSARFAIVSSAYNVVLEYFHGATSELLFMLPGDEVDRFAVSEDRGRIFTNITVRDFEAAMSTKVNNYAIRLTSYGKSRIDGIKRAFTLRNATFEDIDVTSVTRTAGKSFRYGINANGTRGENVVFRNISLDDLASREFPGESGVLASYGMFVRDGSGIRFENVQTRARFAVGIVDSRDIVVTGGVFDYLDLGSMETSYGVYVGEGDAPVFHNANLTIENTTVTGYDVGIRYPAVTAETCELFSLEAITFTDVPQPESGNACIE